MSADPHAPAVTFLAGHPMLMSTIAAPTPTAISAAAASASGSRPKICTANRRPSRLAHIRPTALAAPRVSASAERNSVKVRVAPSSSQTVRNGRSVTASIGANRAPGLSWMSPMRIRVRENSIALAGFVVLAALGGGCRRASRTAKPGAAPAAAPATGPEALLADVFDPWGWVQQKVPNDRTSAREHAIEDIGPFE